MYKKIIIFCCVVVIAALSMLSQGVAKDGEWVENEHFRSRLAAVPEGGNSTAVFVLELEDGWHTYGDPPGDAGLPPRFNWEGSTNVESVEINWPEPIHKREMDMFDVNAYEGQVNFPLTITPKNPDEDVTLDLDLQVMVCNEICIPDKAELSLDLKATSRTP
ncbi:MAG: protein-disulfide reductase DsbD family protein [Alphaproteobacteria bacterium]